MNYSNLMESLGNPSPPEGISRFLQAMWWEANGKWDLAHELVQDDPAGAGAWIHGYLHRVEGDEWNAGYWYRRAQKPFPSNSLKEEWEEIVQALLS